MHIPAKIAKSRHIFSRCKTRQSSAITAQKSERDLGMRNWCQKKLERPPVACERTFEPKEVLMVVVKETALRLESTTDR